jgi:hypothetical protein
MNPASDYFGVHNTLNKVMLMMDRGDGEGFADCFAEDGTCEVVLTKTKKKGPSELADLCRFIKSKFPNAQHLEGNITLREVYSPAEDAGHSSSATASSKIANRSYWFAIDGGLIVSMGVHEDVLVKVVASNSSAKGGKPTAPSWKLSERKIIHTWTKAGGYVSKL